MNSMVHLALRASPQQHQRLADLQKTFAQVCNALAPLVQQTRCWNRVALHHMAYKQLRQQFPAMGSQMVCNAIYSVSRTSRLVYQHPASPFNLARLGDRSLPQLQFMPEAPVYFDRHTLSLKDGQASMFTLDGRMRFQLDLTPDIERRFREEKLREVVLNNRAGSFVLSFLFAGEDPAAAPPSDAAPSGELPEYVLITEDATTAVPADLTRTTTAPAAPLSP